MRRKLAAAFALGFACGMAALGVTLLMSNPGRRVPQTAGRVVMAAPSTVVSKPAPAAIAGQPRPEPLLAMPLAGIDPAKLTSTFRQTRDGRPHEALDIMAPRGTPVMAVAAGTVAKLFTSKLGGLTVYQFDNSDTWCYYYAHLDHYQPGLMEGGVVRKGEVLGYVGSTGDASPDAPHLHFAVFRLGPEKQWWKGTAVDPLPLFK